MKLNEQYMYCDVMPCILLYKDDKPVYFENYLIGFTPLTNTDFDTFQSSLFDEKEMETILQSDPEFYEALVNNTHLTFRWVWAENLMPINHTIEQLSNQLQNEIK